MSAGNNKVVWPPQGEGIGDLLVDEAREKHEKVVAAFKASLGRAPFCLYTIVEGGKEGPKVNGTEELVIVGYNGRGGGLNALLQSKMLDLYSEGRSKPYYHIDLSTMPIVAQIAMIVDKKGRPDEFYYSFNGYAIGVDSETLDEQSNETIPFSEVECAIIEAARSLSPEEYAEMSLEQIGADLRKKEAQEQHEKVVAAFKASLGRAPNNYNSVNRLRSITTRNEVHVVYGGGDTGEEQQEEFSLLEEVEKYVYEGSYSTVGTVESTVAQIAMLVAKKGSPESITYYQEYNFKVDRLAYIRLEKYLNGIIPFSEVEGDILEAARSLSPEEYAEMSLEQIGADLRKKEENKTQEE